MDFDLLDAKAILSLNFIFHTPFAMFSCFLPFVIHLSMDLAAQGMGLA